MLSWLHGITHELAYNYHWSKREILDDVCLDEALIYRMRIRGESVKQQLLDLQASIAPNLEKSAKESLIRKLQYQLEKHFGDGSDGDVDPETHAKNMDILKNLMGVKKKKKGKK